jgi:CheY-like chemotaxis protein
MEKMLARLLGVRIELATSLGANLRPVKADPGQIEQVIMNLAVNARDAMPNGGRLTIATANADLGATAGAAEARHVVLSVADTGQGMTEEVKARIFEPFFTTKEAGKGTGLGLATVEGIVRQSGGHIDVTSAPGKGTTFLVYLPQATDVQSPVRARPSKAEPSRRAGTETVLVVDDDADVRALACQALRGGGYEVLEARGGDEAVRLCEAHAAPIHLVVADVVMPGTTGRGLADQLKSRRPELKVLFISGHPDDELVKQGVLEPGLDFLPKPFTPATLTAKARAVLDSA